MICSRKRRSCLLIPRLARLVTAVLGVTFLFLGGGALGGAEEATKQIAVDDAKVVLAPYAWKCFGKGPTARAEATMPGAYFKAVFQGSTTIGVVIDGTANDGCPAASMPVIEYSVDDGPFRVVPLTRTGGLYTLPLADKLSSAARHRLEFYFRAADLGQNRWTASTAHLRIAGISVDEGGELFPCPMRSKKAIAFGDSITEGVGVDSEFTSWQILGPNSARCNWFHFVCCALDCEYGQFGSGGQGMVNTAINLPPLPKTWDHYDATTSRLRNGRLLPEPDYVLCNMGNNDGTSSLTNDYVAWVNAVRAACPHARIFCIVPPAGVHRDEVRATVNACNQAGDARVYLTDIPLMKALAPNTGKPTQGSFDGGHPTLYGQAVFGASVGVEIQKVLDRENHATPTVQADFYVAPDGKDDNPGDTTAPFATLARARNAVREKVAAGLTKDILVMIRGGTYFQADTLAFGPDDSGNEKYSITYASYPGEEVVISGGRKITGWKKGDGELWTVEIPEVKAGRWYFRQLFVNGNRATRARTPNADDKKPWWIIKTSAVSEQEDKPFTVSVNGRIDAYNNPGDVELVVIYNNEGGRKRLGSIDEKQQTFTIAPPHRWSPKCFGADWHLAAPQAGKACYLENALKMLDQPGEWYLDRPTGILHYWPRPGEDLTRDEVMAPVVQHTLLAVAGTRAKPVINLHFKGLHVEYVDWPLPAWGYGGLFCCNVVVDGKDKPGHRFIEAAVEFEHARSCNFMDGGIAHVGANGLCLRDGTAYNIIEGNEISDLGGNGIGAGGCNVAGGYLHAAPPPEPGEYKGYRIANNHIHDCGTDYHGGSGICLYLSQDAVVAHNLVHDTAYFGIGVAGSQDPRVPFAKNNTVEYNHVYRAMKVTVDGAGLYVTFANYGRGTLVRGNLIHDTQWNRFGRGEILNGIHDTIPCHGLYLDGNNTGCRYEGNVVYRNAGGPLLFNSAKKNNHWRDNLFQKEGTPPPEFIEAMESVAGLEPPFRKAMMKTQQETYDLRVLTGENARAIGCGVYQFDCPKGGQGVVEVVCGPESKGDSLLVRLHGLDSSAPYDLKAYVGTLSRADERFYSGTFFGNCDKRLFTTYLAALGDLPILSDVVAQPLSDVVSTSGEGKPRVSGRELCEQGLPVRLAKSPRVVWIVYQRAE